MGVVVGGDACFIYSRKISLSVGKDDGIIDE